MIVNGFSPVSFTAGITSFLRKKNNNRAVRIKSNQDLFKPSLSRLPSSDLTKLYFASSAKEENKDKPVSAAAPPEECLQDLSRVGGFIVGMPTNDPYLKAIEKWNNHIYEIVTRPRKTVDGKMRPWLTPLPTDFHIVNKNRFNAATAGVGFIASMPSLARGKQYYQSKQFRDYGLGGAYESVINTNRANAYLYNANKLFEQVVVIPHVYGHTDCFANNDTFAETNRNMTEVIGLHKTRVEKYMQKYGKRRVYEFIKRVKTLNFLVDLSQGSPPPLDKNEKLLEKLQAEQQKEMQSKKLPALPPGVGHTISIQKFPPEPDRDVLGFVVKYGRGMEDWQRDIVDMLRTEAYYFLPQMKTKIINEGWATFWHRKILGDIDVIHPPKELGLTPLDPADVVPMCYGVDGVLFTQQGINPYRLGYLIFKDIEKKANEEARKKGLVFDEDEDFTPGIEAICKARELYTDEDFVSKYLSDEIIKEEQMFKWVKKDKSYFIGSRDGDEVRDAIVKSSCDLEGFAPQFQVLNSNFNNQWELSLGHIIRWDFQIKMAREELKVLSELWGGSINLDSELIDPKNPENKTPIRYVTHINEIRDEDKQAYYYVDPKVYLYELNNKGELAYELDDTGKRISEVDPKGNQKRKL